MRRAWRRAGLGIVLTSALAAGASADPPAPPPPPASVPPSAPQVAARLLAASRAGDREELARLQASLQPTPHQVAAELWVAVLEAADAAAGAQARTALVEWGAAWRGRPAADGLDEVVARWLALPEAERSLERGFRAASRRILAAVAAKDVPAILTVLDETGPWIAKAPWSLLAFEVLAGAGHALMAAERAEALVPMRRAAEQAEGLGAWALASRCWDRVGALEAQAGRPEAALVCAERNAELCLRVGDVLNHANALRNGSFLLLTLGRAREALARAREAEARAQALGAWLLMARAEDVIAGAESRLGNPEGARRAAERAADLAAKVGDDRLGSEVLFRLAQTLLEQDAWSEAYELFQRLHARAQSPPNDTLLFLSAGALAALDRSLGRPERALARIQEMTQVAATYHEVESRPVLAAEAQASLALTRLLLARRRGRSAPDEDELRRGVAAAREALAVYERENVPRASEGTRVTLARLLLALGEKAEAFRLLDAGRRAPGVAGDRSAVFVLLREAQARDHLAAGRLDEAGQAAREALEVRRTLLRALAEDDALGTREDAVATSALVVEAAARRRAAHPEAAAAAAAEAFAAAEGARALLLTEGLLHGRAVLWRDLPPALVDEDERTRTAVKEAREAWLDAVSTAGASAAPALAAAGEALALAWTRRDDVVERTQRAARRASAFVDPPAPDLEGVAAALAPDDALVLYQTAGGEAAHAVVVRRTGARLVDLGPAAAIEARAEAWLRVLPAADGDDREAAAVAHDLLVRPLEPALAGARRLLLVPDGVLAFVPFEALLRRTAPGGPGGGAGSEERLVERYDVAYAPSAGVLAALRGESGSVAAGRGVLALGDPDLGAAAAQFPALTASRAEAEALVARVPEAERTLLLGKEAGVERLLAALGADRPRRRVVHLACHGLVNPAVPRATGLLLAGGEILDVDRLGRERWNADLVTLAACDSGRGRVVAGEGVLGLVRAVLLTGVPRVVTSQWVVDDGATRRLMDAFYDGLLTRSLPPARALAEAKRAVLAAGGPGASPALWAAFVLWGLPD